MRAASYTDNSSLLDPSATLLVVAVSAGSGSALVLAAIVAYLCCRKPEIDDVEKKKTKNENSPTQYYHDPDYEDVGLPYDYYTISHDDIHYEDLPDIKITKHGSLNRSYENAGGAYYNDKFHAVTGDDKENDYLEPTNLVPTGNVTSNVIKTVQRIEAYKTNSTLGSTLTDPKRNDGENIVIRESLELIERERELKVLSVGSSDCSEKSSAGSGIGIESGTKSNADPGNGMSKYLENILGDKGDVSLANSHSEYRGEANKEQSMCVKSMNRNVGNVPSNFGTNCSKPEIPPKASYVKMLVKSLSQDVTGPETSARSRVTRNDTQPLRRKLEASQSASGPFGPKRENRVLEIVRSLSQWRLDSAEECDEYHDVDSDPIADLHINRVSEKKLNSDQGIISQSIDASDRNSNEQITSGTELNVELHPNFVSANTHNISLSDIVTPRQSWCDANGNIDSLLEDIDDTGDNDLSFIVPDWLDSVSVHDESSVSAKQSCIVDERVGVNIISRSSSACLTSRSMIV